MRGTFVLFAIVAVFICSAFARSEPHPSSRNLIKFANFSNTFFFIHNCNVYTKMYLGCTDTQQWTDCATACEPQCNNFKGPKCALFMTLQCIPKCKCKEGHARIEGNECAPLESAECGGLYTAGPIAPERRDDVAHQTV